MANHNKVLQGRYSMLSNGVIVNNAGETVAFSALAVVSYDGVSDSDGAGNVMGAGVTKTTKSVGVLNVGGPEPLALQEFTVVAGSKYWIDPEELTGRALFLVDFGDGNPHTVHYYFVIVDGGKEVEFLLTHSDPHASAQSGTQRRISEKPLQ